RNRDEREDWPFVRWREEMVITATLERRDRWPWLMLPARLALFAFWQMIMAVILALWQVSDAWLAAAAWWPLTAALTNLVCLGLLWRLYQQEGRRFWEIFRFQRQTLKKDLLILLATLILAGP